MSKIVAILMSAAALACAPAAHAAGVLTFHVAGTFDATDPSFTGSNLWAVGMPKALVGTDYSMSWTIGTDSRFLNRTEYDLSQTPPQHAGWFFNTDNSVSNANFSYAHGGGGVVADVTNDFAYDGSLGIVPAGTYDILNLTGWARGSGPVVDPVACPHPAGGSLLGDTPAGPCSLAGGNVAIDLTLIGSSGMIGSLETMPFGSLDLSKALYVTTEMRGFNNGALTAEVTQDPPVSYVDGFLLGDGLSLSVVAASVPEPAAWALMLLGFAGLGAMLRSQPKRMTRRA